MTNEQMVVIMEGPDGCGKTEIGKALAKEYAIPYFKVSYERDCWNRDDGFLNALQYDQTYISEFLEQTGHGCVIDRAYPSEYVYSHVFGRKTNGIVLSDVDTRFWLLGAVIVICLRKDYTKAREDELIASAYLTAIHDRYQVFSSWTACSVIKLYVDDHDNDINKQLPLLTEAIINIDKRPYIKDVITI